MLLKCCKALALFLLVFNSGGKALLDVTLVINKPVVAYNEEIVIKCVADNNYFHEDYFPFALEADIGAGPNLTEDRTYERNEPVYWPGYQLKISARSGASKHGFVSCTARNNETEENTKVTGLVMSQNALVFPKFPNYQASLNSSVAMAVIQTRRRLVRGLLWYRIQKNELPKQAAVGKLQINIERVTKELEGPYMVFYPVRDNTMRVFQQGMTRLLVRGCTENKFGESCTSECPPCENGGICDDKNGTCICPPGFMGKWCEIGCGPNRFGKFCQHICSEDEDTGCKGKLFCLPDPFGCSCATGYTTTLCSYECRPGFYGHNCALPCHCIDNKCDAYTGNCTVGCSSGWMGLICQTPCLNGTYGSNCNETCGSCSGGPFSCDQDTGYCPKTKINDTELLSMASDRNTSYCLFGYRPPICKESCRNGTWSLDCDKICRCLNNTACNVRSGFCQTSFEENGMVLCDPGWMGDACNETCSEGFYGEKCAEPCGNCKDETPCHHISGACVASRGECEPGYAGWKCDQPCNDGYFGARCSFICNCANGTSCDHITGACDGFCQAGFTGENCHQSCPFGTYGLNCSQECANCKQVPANRRIPLCDQRLGKCTAGCTKAWAGDRCDEGILCEQNPCFNDGTCIQSGDYYSCHCSKAFSGSHCEIRNPPCLSAPCKNNGRCVEINSKSFECECAENYEGDTCEIDKNKEAEPTTKSPAKTPDEGGGGGGTNKEEDSDIKTNNYSNSNESNNFVIIAALCLGVVIVLCTIALLLKSCFM